MADKPLPTPEQLRQLLDYDPETGAMTWRARRPDTFPEGKMTREHNASAWNAQHAGKAAFLTKSGNGYLQGFVFNRKLFAHRVAWAMHYGKWPKQQIDHINGNGLDNRITNLRDVDNAENRKNQKRNSANTSGVMGVGPRPNGRRWRAEIKIGGKRLQLGTFDTFEEAVAARKSAEARLGFHPNHGRLS